MSPRPRKVTPKNQAAAQTTGGVTTPPPCPSVRNGVPCGKFVHKGKHVAGEGEDQVTWTDAQADKPKAKPALSPIDELIARARPSAGAPAGEPMGCNVCGRELTRDNAACQPCVDDEARERRDAAQELEDCRKELQKLREEYDKLEEKASDLEEKLEVATKALETASHELGDVPLYLRSADVAARKAAEAAEFAVDQALAKLKRAA